MVIRGNGKGGKGRGIIDNGYEVESKAKKPTAAFENGEYIESCGGLPAFEPIPEGADRVGIEVVDRGEKQGESRAEEKPKAKGNGVTEIVFILDKSGSMAGLEADTIGGYNSFIEGQRSIEGTAYVTTVMFSTNFVKVHDRAPLSSVEPLTDRDYRVGGGTALYDALGDTIEHIQNIHRYIRPEDVPEKTVFVITTDGEENSSHRYGSEKIKGMVERCEKERGWEFLFLGANIDAFAAADRIGIRRERATSYDTKKTGRMFSGVSEAICYCRAVGSVKDDWAKDIDADDED